jgi:hypothetical protein
VADQSDLPSVLQKLSRRDPKAPLGMIILCGDDPHLSTNPVGRAQIAANDNRLDWPFIPFPEGSLGG